MSEVTGTVTPDQFAEWAAPADLDVTVVRTPLSVTETGVEGIAGGEMGLMIDSGLLAFPIE